MTESEFSVGWRMLLLQPWAHRYRAVNEFGEPAPDTKQQQAFYFDNLKQASAGLWLKIAREYAKGKEWPSVDQLKRSLGSLSTPSYARHDPHGGPLLSRDEFTLDLYDAIRLQSCQLQEEQNALHYDKNGFTKIATTSRKNAAQLRDELTAIFQRNTLSPDDLRRVLAIGGPHA